MSSRAFDSIPPLCYFFFFNDTATTEIYTLSLHDPLPICNFLAHLVNLKELELGNIKDKESSSLFSLFRYRDKSSRERIKVGIYNRFFGSLAPKKRLNKLEYLNIDNTDLNSGVKYLPSSLQGFNKHGDEKISYSTKNRPTSQVRTIA